MSARKQLRLGAFLMSSGHHLAAWRHPDAKADGGLSFEHFKQVAQTAERGKFDMIFFADGVQSAVASLHVVIAETSMHSVEQDTSPILNH